MTPYVHSEASIPPQHQEATSPQLGCPPSRPPFFLSYPFPYSPISLLLLPFPLPFFLFCPSFSVFPFSFSFPLEVEPIESS